MAMNRFAVGLALWCAAQLCLADDLIIMPGPAVYKCKQWSDAKDGALRLPLAMWVFGYVSGSNFRTAEHASQAKVFDNDAALVFADKYCQANPDHALAQLGSAMVEKFGGPKAKHEWKVGS